MSASNTGSNFFDCTVHRRLTGLELRLTSVQIEEVMKVISGGHIQKENASAKWNHEPGYYALNFGSNGIPVEFPGFTAGRFDMWGARELLLAPRNPPLNLSMFTAVGLGSGISIKIPTVISEPQLKQYTDGLASACRQFYIDFLKESTKNIRITTEEFS